MKYLRYCLPFLIFGLGSCSCAPEELIRFAFSGMDTMLGGGFMPSEQLRALGGFTSTSVNLSKTSENGVEESVIFLILENGDPKILAENREILARKCAELYLKEFEDAEEYDKITVQLVQSDPFNPENVSLEEYTFEVQDF
ncbi:MAG: hypothetical protein RL407_2196 [Bacteroidota bacterium]|jgi:hypothetical protein